MASAPIPIRPQTTADPDHPWLADMRRLVERAKLDRSRHQSRIADCYKYAMPWRHKFFMNTPGADYDEVFDETVATVLEDFAADMQNTFTPQKDNWLSEEPAPQYDQAQRREFEAALKKRQKFTFSEMARSNLYQAMQESYSDLGPGTMIMIVTDIGADKPFHCESLPITDVLLAKGPYGSVDPFRSRKYLRSEILAMWPEANMALLGADTENKQDQEFDVTDGCWRDWTDRGNETYRYAVEANGKIIYNKEYKGAGACPFIVARWARDNTTAWGVGPTYRVLPAIKMLNHFNYNTAKNYDKHLDPVVSYEDDGVMNLDNGITPGLWIPRAPNSKAPEVVEAKTRLDYEAFQIDAKRSIIRRAHYQDEPEQLGKTPPTATQWADEAAKKARRMGTPATNLVQEWQIPIYRRFTYLEEQRGVLPKVETRDGQAVALQPVSPLLRAQEQEEVVRNDKFVELVVARFGPQIAMVTIDVIEYVKAQAAKLGIDPKLIRDEAKMKAAIETLAPVLKATGFLPGSTPNVAVPPTIPGAPQ